MNEIRYHIQQNYHFRNRAVAIPDHAAGNMVECERVAIDAAGRLVVPGRFRKALGIQGPQHLVIGLEGDTLRLSTTDGVIRRYQDLARRRKRTPGSVVDAFIAERRREAAEE